MPEKIKNNIGMLITIAGFLVMIFTGGVGYGQLSNKTDTMDQNIKIHCVNQMQSEKELSKVLLQLAEANATLSNEVKNLKESVVDLRQEMRRIR